MLKPSAPVLALAGNIGEPKLVNYAAFLDYCSRNWDHTYLVPGYTEFGSNSKEWNKRMWFLDCLTKTYKNVHFLNRQVAGLRSFRILGAPLLTDIDADKQWLLKAKRACAAQGLVAVTLTANAPTRFWNRSHMSREEQETLEWPLRAAIYDHPDRSEWRRWGDDIKCVSNPYGLPGYSRETCIDISSLQPEEEEFEWQEKGPNLILEAAAKKDPQE